MTVKIVCRNSPWGRPVLVAPSEGHPWNGWVTPLGEEPALESFEAGSYLAALEHLRQCPGCRRASGLPLREVQALLRKIEEKWNMVVEYEVHVAGNHE